MLGCRRPAGTGGEPFLPASGYPVLHAGLASGMGAGHVGVCVLSQGVWSVGVCVVAVRGLSARGAVCRACPHPLTPSP